ncbi:hypothetical protein D9619_004105 [Psilocybe cf. subviscida]|uniref:NACHT domain-containing protein n=1 Tax=Psilocybe cf. subviscida TaxID=2480587 RepID=A0A8H5BP40_9AGAR|nr:hypothetical protein D9619_004105 [Psilocybe cf. subviscida]
MQQTTSPSPSGNILQSASHVIITGGSFVVGSQSNVTTTVNEPNKWLEFLHRKVAHNAILNAGGRADAVKCFPGTREEVLARIEAWIDGKGINRERRIFWLSGPAGAGKSAIVQTLAERCMARGVPMINFFFFRGDFTRNRARSITPTLLYQLFTLYPELKPLVGAVFGEKPMILSQTQYDQVEHLIQNPIRTIQEDSIYHQPIVLLIDGLDECNSAGKHEQEVLLQVFHGLISCENSPFIVLVASRPEPHLTMTFNEVGSCAESIFLDENYRPSDDIRLFVVAELTRIKNTHHLGRTLDDHWPSESSISAIVDKSSGQFIYAATVLRFIANSSASPALSLDKVLGLRPVKKSSPFAELDAIYTYILSQVEDWDATKDVLAAQIFNSAMREPMGRPVHITLHTILHPVGYQKHELASYTSDLTAVVKFEHRRDELIFYHASLSDFFCDSMRSGEYHIDIDAFTERIAPAHIKGIWDLASSIVSFLVVARVNQPTPSVDEALTSCPPHFEWRRTIESTVDPFVYWFSWFLEILQKLYFHKNNQLYQLILRNWLIWFRDLNIVPPGIDFESAELANAIWKEIITTKSNLVKGETPCAQQRAKKTPLWRRILQAP